MGGDELKWHLLTHNQLMSPQGPNFSPHSTAKPTIKAQISRRMVFIGISDVVTASVYSEKTSLKKLMMIIMNKSQETTVFHGCQKLTSAMNLKAIKVIVDIQICCSMQVCLFREPPEVGGVKKLT